MTRRPTIALGLLAPLVAGAALRLAFWAMMDASWNDAYDYALNARFIRDGEWFGVSRFQYTFFSVVAAAIDVFVRDAVLAGEIVSLLAGVAVIVLVYRIGFLLAGPLAAACAAWIAALHPRLVEYSTVGYTESLLTALVTGGLLAAASHLTRAAPPAPGEPARGPATAGRADLWAAALFAVAFLVRNETLFYLPVVLLVLALADLECRGLGAALRRTARRSFVALVVTAVPTALAWALLGSSPIFQKGAANVALGAAYDVEAMGEWEARIYAVDEAGRLVEPDGAPETLGPGDRARVYGANLLNLARFYLLRLAFSPLLLAFAAVGLLGVPFRPGTFAAEGLLLAVWAVPHLFYPLVVVQPQYLIQTLPVLAFWAGRGAVRSVGLLRESSGISARTAAAALAVVVAMVVAPLLAGTALIARERVVDRGPFARIAGEWLASHNGEQPYMGSDPGLTYYSGNFEQLALPAGVNAAELPRVARANGASFVVLKTGDLESRPELARLLASEPPATPELRRELRETDGGGNVLAIYRVTAPPSTRGG